MALRNIVVLRHGKYVDPNSDHYFDFERLCDKFGLDSRESIPFDCRVHTFEEFNNRWPSAKWFFPDPLYPQEFYE